MLPWSRMGPLPVRGTQALAILAGLAGKNFSCSGHWLLASAFMGSMTSA
ncbi:MAG: hypothetical protein RMJ43_02735 [Chloroherpetonaceae bacterium]|nr:hypothetical protein [Chthonomonadaceae bacterium]MDW8206727.1 hypothetical protein [Chloroherpetonaceae bacterium]